METQWKIASPLGDRRGFTLVEVLVAAMILVVALLTLASMFPVGYRQITDAGPQPSVPDSRDPRGSRTGLAEPGLPRRLSRAFPVDRSVLYVSGIVSEFWNDRSLSGRA